MKTSSENKAVKDAYCAAFVKRVKLIREASEVDPATVADRLGVKLDTYYRYESKVMMPHYLIPRFLAITNGDLAYLIGMRKAGARTALKTVG